MKRIFLLSLLLAGLVFSLSGCSLFNQGPDIQNWQPGVNPSSGEVIFADKDDKDFELYVMDRKSGDKKQITNNEYDDWGPGWGPNGERVVFVSQRNDNTDIYVLDPESGDETRLTTDDGQDVNPKWSGEDKVIFNSDRTGSWEIFEVSADGGGLKQVTFSSEGSEG
ncbi:PD40 domain-containing protein [Candidatus Bipolaricaulota bacterium]|nr:PD40 domain-containing protein [Candidatus Bipolaricaulota bacterium]